MLRIGVSKTKELYVSFINIKNRPEILYSQLKVKCNKYYHLVLSVKVGLTFRDICLYVNAQVESMVTAYLSYFASGC